MLVYCSQTVGWIKMPLGTEVGLGPGLILLDGDPAPHPRKGHSSPHFSAHVYCGQTAGWIRIPLDKEVGLGPGHIVLVGNPVGTQPPTAAPPHFRPMPIMAKRSPISATAELLFDFSRWRPPILDFQNVTILGVGRTKTAKVRHRAKFCGDRSSRF